MGEFSASDCSWKKMVIAKADDHWISTIKAEQTDIDDAVNVAPCSITDQLQIPRFDSLKREHLEVSVDPTPLNIHHAPNVADYYDVYQETDPLQIDEEPTRWRRRRKTSTGSGPKNETPDERAARLAKMSAYAAQRLANETPEQRAMRLKRMSDYAAKRLAQETSEQRAKRLARMSAYAARRLAKETPQQRQARLARMSAYAARRQALKKAGGSSTEDPDPMAYYPHTNTILPDQS